MRPLIFPLTLFSCFCFLIGCASTIPGSSYVRGEFADVSISKNFDLSRHKKVAVLPIINQGKDGVDITLSDKFSVRLMELGFVVVERTKIERTFNQLGIELDENISSFDYSEIGNLLDVDVVVIGTANYDWVPGRTLIYGSMAGAVDGAYVINSESLRFVDIGSDEVLISCYCNIPNPMPKGYSISDEIIHSLKKRLAVTD